VLGTTEAWEAVPPEAGAISTDLDVLAATLRRLLRDPDEARSRGELARAHVLARYGLQRFLDDWDALLVPAEVTR
jgi:glycosyl transferase family 1